MNSTSASKENDVNKNDDVTPPVRDGSDSIGTVNKQDHRRRDVNDDDNDGAGAAAAVESADASPAKRQKTTAKTTTVAAAAGDGDADTSDGEERLFDPAAAYGYKAGDQIEVQWELQLDEEDEETGKITTKNVVRWWKATLLPYDDDNKDPKKRKAVDNVAIRTLHYEALPEFGFDESKEDVIFLSLNTLVTPPDLKDGETVHLDDLTKLTYRRAGRPVALDPQSVDAVLGGNASVSPDDAVIDFGDSTEEGWDAIVNNILETSMSKLQSQFKAMPAAQQAFIATKIAHKKEQLKHALMDKAKTLPVGTALTQDDVKELLASLA